MPESDAFVEQEKSLTARHQTLTPKDFLNKNYILRYEDVVASFNYKSTDRFDQEHFFAMLRQLYWSYVEPRLYYFKDEESANLKSLYEKIESRAGGKELITGFELLSKIGKLMHSGGVLKTERDTPDPYHIWEIQKTVIPI